MSSQDPYNLPSDKQSKKVPPKKKPNVELRSREFITPAELDKLVTSAKKVGRHGERDSFLIFLAYRHAMRSTEISKLMWNDVDFDNQKISFKRLKSGIVGEHSLNYFEIQKLKELKESNKGSKYIFCSERQGALTSRAIHSIISRAGEEAGLDLSVHPQMLCTGRGFQLVAEGWNKEQIQQYLGHKTDRIVVNYFDKIRNYLQFVKKYPSYLDKGIPVVNFKSASEALAGENAIEHSILIEVPASTCNLGPGLDTIGLALSLYTRITFKLLSEEHSNSPMMTVEGKMSNKSRSTEQGDLTYALLSKLWKYEPQLLNRIEINVDSDIPLGCGLGGTGTAVLGAVWASHIFHKKLPTCNSLLKECSYIEGHPETMAASLLGGMVVYGYSDKIESNLVHHIDWPEDWSVIISLPSYCLSTVEARKVLPDKYSRQDLIHNLQHVALLVSAVVDSDEELMGYAMNDRVHETYRSELVPELLEIRELLKHENIIGCVLSGGGSSVATIVNKNNKQRILEKLEDWARKDNRKMSIFDLFVPNTGMREIVQL